MTQIESAIQAFETKQSETVDNTSEQEEVVPELPEIQVLKEGTFFNVTLADIERRLVNPGADSDYLLLSASEDRYDQITGVVIGGTLNSGEIVELAANTEIQKTPGESWYVVKDEGGFDFLTWTGVTYESIFVPRKGGGHEGDQGEKGEIVTEPVKEDEPAPDQVDPIPPEPVEPAPPPPIIEPDPTPVQEPQDIPEPAAMPKAPAGLPPSLETIKTKKIIELNKPKASVEANSNLKIIQLRR